MKHATSRLLFAYWDSLRGDRSAPERSQIEPGRIRHILADTFILAQETDGRPVFRLAGTRVNALFARDLKDVGFCDLWPADRRTEAEGLVDIVCGDAVGAVAGLVAETGSGEAVALELLLLPLRHLGTTNRRMIGALSPGSVPSWLGLSPVEALDMRSLRIVGGRPQPEAGFAELGPAAAAKRHRFVVLDGGLAP